MFKSMKTSSSVMPFMFHVHLLPLLEKENELGAGFEKRQ